MSTKLSVFFGTPVQLSGGEMLSSSWWWSDGISPPSLKTCDVSVNGPTGAAGSFLALALPPPGPR